MIEIIEEAILVLSTLRMVPKMNLILVAMTEPMPMKRLTTAPMNGGLAIPIAKSERQFFSLRLFFLDQLEQQAGVSESEKSNIDAKGWLESPNPPGNYR